MSKCLGSVPKALEMSIVAMRMRSGGLLLLKPSIMSCVVSVRVVVMECNDQKPCCEASRGMCFMVFVNTRCSSISERVLSSEIGP